MARPDRLSSALLRKSCRTTNRWSRPRTAWRNVGNFHVCHAIFAPAHVSGGGSPQALGGITNRADAFETVKFFCAKYTEYAPSFSVNHLQSTENGREKFHAFGPLKLSYNFLFPTSHEFYGLKWQFFPPGS